MFLISADGRSAEEIIAALTDRLGNDPDTELRVPDETLPNAQIATRGETRPFALIAGTGDDGA